MRRYETIFILDTALTEADRTPLMERMQNIIVQHQGVLVSFEHWGEQKLAYDIRGKGRGYYIRMDFCGDGTLVRELERYFRITDSFLKFLTVMLEKDIDVSTLPEQAETTFRGEAASPAPVAEIQKAARLDDVTDDTDTETGEEN